MYEFNRAYCNIKLDPVLKGGRESAKALSEEICSDLESAAATTIGREAIEATKPVKRWLKQNKPNPRVKALRARLGLRS